MTQRDWGCPICGDDFSNQRDLEAHLDDVHEDDDVPVIDFPRSPYPVRENDD